MKTPNLLFKKTRWVVIAVVVLALGGALAFWLSRDHGQQDALRLYGNVDIREVQLAFRQPGRVMQMAFDEGDAVSAGARLAALDAQPYREALAAAQAQVQVAQAELAKLRRGLRPQEITQAREALRQAQALATEFPAPEWPAGIWRQQPAHGRCSPHGARPGSRWRRSGQGGPVASIRRFSQGRHRRGRSSPCGRTGCRSASHDSLGGHRVDGAQ